MLPNSLVQEHFQNPRHVGEFATTEFVSTAKVGSVRAGDIIQLQCKTDSDGKITAAKFKAYGSHYTIACASYAVDFIIGKSAAKAVELSANDLIKALELPKTKQYCAIMVEDVIKVCLKL